MDLDEIKEILDMMREHDLAEFELERDGVVSPPRTLRSGRRIGGRPFSRGQLYAILRSPIYVGNIPHKGAAHPGLHEPIIDRAMWERVQTTLTEHVQGHRRGERTASTSPLSGKVFDAAGAPLIASQACKGRGEEVPCSTPSPRKLWSVSRPGRPAPTRTAGSSLTS